VQYESRYIAMWLESCVVDPGKEEAPKEEEIVLVDGAFEIHVGRPSR